MIKEQRSGVSQENIQELIDSDESKGMAAGKMEQYFSPKDLAEWCWDLLPSHSPATVIDPQCGQAALLKNEAYSYGTSRFGVELDERIQSIAGVNLITGGCQKVFDLIEDLYPHIRFVCANANPPFSRRWKQPDGTLMDSTQATWNFVTKHANYGFFIAGRKTIESLGLNKHPLTYQYHTKFASEYWKGMKADMEIGIIHWQRPKSEHYEYTSTSELYAAWTKIREAVDQEKSKRPDFNIYLENGLLKTYLSIRNEVKLKLDMKAIERLAKINGSHPLTLTTEKETRHLLRDFVTQGIYVIQPEAKAAIEAALAEVERLAVPIMEVTEFERVAYCDEEDVLKCIKSASIASIEHRLHLTAGKSYPLTTGTYRFTESFKRNKVHFNESAMETYVKEHDCVLSGSDRYIQITDDYGSVIKFMDRPRKSFVTDFEVKLLWEYFDKPGVKTVAEALPQQVTQNLAVLRALEMTAGYEYFKTKDGGGQMGYLSRLAVKDKALAAAETGAGKTLIAISLLAMKSPKRALIVAPQGAIRSSANEDDDESESESPNAMDASQWVKELARFAPHLQVFEIFSYADYERICSMNGGVLPEGCVYVTYYEAMFSNGAREKVPDTWDDLKLNKWAKAERLGELPLQGQNNQDGKFGITKRFNCDTVGKEVNGIRCIINPCLSTLIGDLFDCVMLDEAHKCVNLGANLSQMVIRLQPKFRYALTATPIPNVISNIFSLMGWLACDDWYKGGRLNAAFPYARADIGKFNGTFLSIERDLTQEDDNRRIAELKGKKWSGSCVKESPIISSPARLLKILKPTMAFISKAQCSDTYIPPKIIDVRVKMGKEQTKLYGHFLDRANIKGNSGKAINPLVRARLQTAYLRNICADPAGFRHGGPKVYSNMNPKVIAILELVDQMMARGEQVVIINSRLGLNSTIQEKLCECGIRTARIDSTMTAEQHSGQANLFKSRKAQVMLMGIKSAAAYSFDECENCIIGSLEFTPGSFVQAKGRIDRVCNKVVKNIYVILHKDALDEIMFDTVATKDDAATICLRGCRVPRNFVPQTISDVLAKAVDHFDMSGGTPESECEKVWPKLRFRIQKSLVDGWV
jgi:predicted RNA methylase